MLPNSVISLSYEDASLNGDGNGMSEAVKVIVVISSIIIALTLFCGCMYYQLNKDLKANKSKLHLPMSRRRAHSEDIRPKIDVFAPSEGDSKPAKL